MSIGSICEKSVDVARADETCWQAAERMLQRGVGALVVVDSRRIPIGIVTDRDLLTRVMAKARDPYQTVLCDVMTADPALAYEDTPEEVALERMRSGGFRRLPVVERSGELLGIVTLDDILMHYCREFSDIGRLLKKETPAELARAR